MTHTLACDARRLVWQKERGVFTSKYPNHCKVCNGDGGRTVRYDPSASGVSLASGYMEDFDECLACLGKGICPRCGKELSCAADYDYCECGYTTDATEENPPAVYSCYCYENMQDEAES